MPYSNDEMVDAALRIILRTGQLTQEYQDWKEEQDQTWAAFKDWWPAKIQLKRRVSSAASKYGFGGRATELQQMQQGVNDFANAHAQTVATMNGLQEQNTQLGQLLQNSQQQVAAIQAQMNQMQLAAAMQPVNYTSGYGGRGNGGW